MIYNPALAASIVRTRLANTVQSGNHWTAREPERHQTAYEHAPSSFPVLAARPGSAGGHVVPLRQPGRQLRRRSHQQRRSPPHPTRGGLLGKEIAGSAGGIAFEEGAHLPECPFLES